MAGSSAAAGQDERWVPGIGQSPRVPAADVHRRREPGIPEPGHCSELVRRGAGRKRVGKSAHSRDHRRSSAFASNPVPGERDAAVVSRVRRWFAEHQEPGVLAVPDPPMVGGAVVADVVAAAVVEAAAEELGHTELDVVTPLPPRIAHTVAGVEVVGEAEGVAGDVEHAEKKLSVLSN